MAVYQLRHENVLHDANFSTLWLFDGDEIWLGGGGTRKQSVGDGWMSHEETR